MNWNRAQRQEVEHNTSGFEPGMLGETARALDAAAAAHTKLTEIPRLELVSQEREATAEVRADHQPKAEADEQSRQKSAGGSANPPAGNGPGAGGPGNGGPAGPGSGGPFNHPAPPGAAKTMAAVLGEVVWLMSQSPLHKQFFISDLEWFVMTPTLLQQFRTFYATDKPLGVVLWASVNDEVAKRLAEGSTRLQPQDWKSGDQIWVVEVVAPFGGAEEMVKDLKANVFPAREVHYLAVKDGRKEVKVL